MILSCGEALIDMLPRKSTTGEDVFLPCGGGAAFNTAIALGRLGVPVGLLAGLSSDMFGDILRAEMASSDVSEKCAVVSQRPTTLAFVRLVNGVAQYAFFDKNTAGRMLQSGDMPAIPAEVQAMIFGGISLASPPSADSFEALMQTQSKQRVIVIDPNIRADFIDDEASYRARIDRMIALSDIVKVSDDDLRWLNGTGDIPDLAEGILQKGAKVVFVTLGGQGAQVFTKNLTLSRSGENVDLVDTVGAGDTFNAGMLAALYQAGVLDKTGIATLDQKTLAAALDLGVRAAAISVSRAGANPPRVSEL